MKRYDDYSKWEIAVAESWPRADRWQGMSSTLISYFDRGLPPGQREVARWNNNEQRGWVKQ